LYLSGEDNKQNLNFLNLFSTSSIFINDLSKLDASKPGKQIKSLAPFFSITFLKLFNLSKASLLKTSPSMA